MSIRLTLKHIAPIAIGTVGALCVHMANPTVPGGAIPTCPSKALFGVCCPGCGTSRMIYSLTNGDIAAAIHYNAVALAFLVVLAWTWVAWVARDNGKQWAGIGQWKHAASVTLAIVVVWGVIRNLPFEPFASLWV